MTINIVNTLNESIWRDFVNEHPQGNIFHTPEMFQVFCRCNEFQPKLWAAVDDNGQLLALLLPVQITLIDGLLRRLTTRSIAYGSVLCSLNPPGEEALALLLNTYSREASQDALFTELRHLSDLHIFQPILDQSGFTYEDYMDYLIDIDKTEDDIWNSITKNGRKAIRKFRNKCAVIEEINNRSNISIFYNLLKQTYNRAGVPLADISLFEAIFDILVPLGWAKLLLVRVKDDYVAASLEMPFKDVIYSWYSGYDRNFRSIYPNDGLVWYILEWGAKNGYRCFDFGGAGLADEPYSVRDFKAKYGGKLVNFGRHTCVHHSFALAISRVGYAFYQQMIKHL